MVEKPTTVGLLCSTPTKADQLRRLVHGVQGVELAQGKRRRPAGDMVLRLLRGVAKEKWPMLVAMVQDE